MKFLFISSCIIVLLACNDSKKTVSIKDRFDAIESIIGTANWQLIDGQDTSYLYFSRMGDGLFNVYHFMIDKGDTVSTKMNTIIGRQDSVKWDWQNTNLFLADVVDSAITWKTISNPNVKYILEKNDNLHISFVFPDGHEAIMKRTLPLATFLVRSHYDYLHDTHTVDSAIVPPRQLLKK